MQTPNTAGPKCPNPGCGNSLDASLQGGYCDACKSAWLKCACNAAVSPLWRHCCQCNHAVAALERAFQLSALPSAGTGPNIRIPLSLQIEEAVSSAPIAYGGYLWWLTSAGNLFRIAPAGRSDLVEILGSEFEKASIALVPARSVSALALRPPVSLSTSGPADPSAQRILLAIAGANHLLLIDPANAGTGSPQARRLIDLPSGLTALRDPNGLTTIAMEGGLVAILAQTISGETQLAVCDIRSPRAASWTMLPVPEPDVAGPLCLGGHFALYGRRTLYLPRDGSLTSHPLPAGFEAVVPGLQPSDWPITNPLLRSPFFSTLHGILVPGERRPPSDSESLAVYQFVFLDETLHPRFSAIVVAQKSMPSELSGERVLFAASGKLQELNEAAISTLSNESNLAPLPCATSPNKLSAACVRNARTLEIRLFPDSRMRFELDSGGAYLVGLHICHNWLVSTALRSDTFFPVIQSWSLL